MADRLREAQERAKTRFQNGHDLGWKPPASRDELHERGLADETQIGSVVVPINLGVESHQTEDDGRNSGRFGANDISKIEQAAEKDL